MILLAKFVLQVSLVSTRKQQFLEAASQLIQKQKQNNYMTLYAAACRMNLKAKHSCKVILYCLFPKNEVLGVVLESPGGQLVGRLVCRIFLGT